MEILLIISNECDEIQCDPFWEMAINGAEIAEDIY